jgi:hypothetical protein
MIVTLTDDAGQVHDVTAHFRLLFDTCVNSLDWGSGFLDFEETSQIVEAGMLAGFDVEHLLPDDAPTELETFREFTAARIEAMKPIPIETTQPEPDVTVTKINDTTWQIQDRRAPARTGYIAAASAGVWLVTVHHEAVALSSSVSGPFSDAYSRVTAALQRDLPETTP